MDVQHPKATRYLTTAEEASIVWDKVAFDVEIDSYSFGIAKVKVKITYAHDRLSVSGARTVVNGEVCNETQPGVYTIKLASWSPIQQVIVQTEVASSDAWARSTIYTMNIIFYLAIIISVIITAISFLKLRKHNKT